MTEIILYGIIEHEGRYAETSCLRRRVAGVVGMPMVGEQSLTGRSWPMTPRGWREATRANEEINARAYAQAMTP